MKLLHSITLALLISTASFAVTYRVTAISVDIDRSEIVYKLDEQGSIPTKTVCYAATMAPGNYDDFSPKLQVDSYVHASSPQKLKDFFKHETVCGYYF